MFMESSTIAAISTPQGTGGIGIVRMSGTNAIVIAERIFRPFANKRLRDIKGYTGLLGRVFDEQGDLDDVIAFVYRAPKSYTGEDVIELSCHGGIWVVRKVLRLCLEHGALPAAPGEFTKRAFLNGKMALSEAESVIDLIEAQSDGAMRAALSARDGALSTEVSAIVEKLLIQSAHLAAWADYPDEDIETVDRDRLADALQSVRVDIKNLLNTWDRGKVLRNGVETVIVGKPNVGKSTLMNLMAGRQRSIVTDIPGTTRDVVEDSIRLGDIILLLSDTAGIRETGDPIENMGVKMAKQRIETADLVLAVFDYSDRLTVEDYNLLELLRHRPSIAVVNKTDLQKRLDIDTIALTIPRIVTVSARLGQGYDELETAVRKAFNFDKFDPTAAMISNERQRICLSQADDSVGEALEILLSGMTLDAVGVTIEYALDALMSLTGKRVSDTILDEVFARFCVGK